LRCSAPIRSIHEISGSRAAFLHWHLRHRYFIDLADGEQFEAVGNFADKDWTLSAPDGRILARISRRWFRIRDTYGVEVEPGIDDALAIAVAVCIDRIHDDEVRKHQVR
jgi:uncharacterized protein YxjI